MLPNCICELPEHQAARARADEDFAMLDGKRFFVRGLLPIPIRRGDQFRYGVWLELAEPDFRYVESVWRDKRRYSALRFRATIADVLDPWGDAALGLGVVGGTRELGVRPHVVAADVPWLATLLLTGWPREDYEAFAHSLLDPDGAD